MTSQTIMRQQAMIKTIQARELRSFPCREAADKKEFPLRAAILERTAVRLMEDAALLDEWYEHGE